MDVRQNHNHGQPAQGPIQPPMYDANWGRPNPQTAWPQPVGQMQQPMFMQPRNQKEALHGPPQWPPSQLASVRDTVYKEATRKQPQHIQPQYAQQPQQVRVNPPIQNLQLVREFEDFCYDTYPADSEEIKALHKMDKDIARKMEEANKWARSPEYRTWQESKSEKKGQMNTSLPRKKSNNNVDAGGSAIDLSSEDGYGGAGSRPAAIRGNQPNWQIQARSQRAFQHPGASLLPFQQQWTEEQMEDLRRRSMYANINGSYQAQLQHQLQRNMMPQLPQLAPAQQQLSQQGPRVLPFNNNAGGGGVGQAYPAAKKPKLEYAEDEPGSVTLTLISTTHFVAKVRKPVPAKVLQYLKLTAGSVYDSERKRYMFPLSSHNSLHQTLHPHVKVTPVPRAAMAAATLAKSEKVEEGKEAEDGEENTAAKIEAELLAASIPPSLVKSLAPFQKAGVSFVLSKDGRALIGDEMGLGKTIQAIACAAAYVKEWPLLIVSPSSARYNWECELRRWLPTDFLNPDHIFVVTGSKQPLPAKARVLITSYDLVNRLMDQFAEKKFGMVIADESHYLKNPVARRTKAIASLVSDAKRVVFLSGTPALSRPMELYMQLHMLKPDVWDQRHEYGARYCAAKKSRFGWDYSGASNIAELHALLRATVMVRRLKKDILVNLPPKKRSLVTVSIGEGAALDQMRHALDNLSTQSSRLGLLSKAAKDAKSAAQKEKDAAGGSSASGSRRNSDGGGSYNDTQDGDYEDNNNDNSQGDGEEKTARELAQERRSMLMKLFADTGTSKIPGAVKHINSVLGEALAGKLLVFAHHRNVLDEIERQVLKRARYGYVRIDGRTKPKERQDLVEKFQSDPNIRVALLGLTAAGVGITLTAASHVVFLELYWTPAQLLQAEDRCHRIGQASEVKIEYLVAKDSLDDCLWALIKQKISLLGEMVEGEEDKTMEASSHTAEDLAAKAKERAQALQEASAQQEQEQDHTMSWGDLGNSLLQDSRELAIADMKDELSGEALEEAELALQTAEDEYGGAADDTDDIETAGTGPDNVQEVLDSDDEEMSVVAAPNNNAPAWRQQQHHQNQNPQHRQVHVPSYLPPHVAIAQIPRSSQPQRAPPPQPVARPVQPPVTIDLEDLEDDSETPAPAAAKEESQPAGEIFDLVSDSD